MLNTSGPSTGTPYARAEVQFFLKGPCEPGIRLIIPLEDARGKANKNIRVFYSVVAQGETPLKDPFELRESFSASKKKEMIHFGFGSSGKVAYFAAQIENGRKKGLMGEMAHTVIP